MTELYKKNGAIFIPVGITLEEIEKLIGSAVEHIQELKNGQKKKESDLNPDCFSGRW